MTKLLGRLSLLWRRLRHCVLEHNMETVPAVVPPACAVLPLGELTPDEALHPTQEVNALRQKRLESTV